MSNQMMIGKITQGSINDHKIAEVNDYLIYPAPLRYTRAMADSIFMKIIKGEIPCHKIYEDDKTFAFLDIHPKTPGHTLVVPKKQVEFVWDLADEDYQALMVTVKKVALRLRDVLGGPYIGELVVGIDVPHAHIHVYSFVTAEESRYVPDQAAEPDHDVLASVAQKLAF